MKDIFKKAYKSTIVFGILTFFILNMFVPVFNVHADDDLVFTFEVENEHDYEVYEDSSRMAIKRKDTNNVNLVDVVSTAGSDISTEVTVSCESKTVCTITVPKEKGSVKFRTNYQDFDITLGSSVINQDTVLSASSTLSIKPPAPNQQPNNNGGEDHFDDPHHFGFNGSAWFVWNCDGNICRYKATNLELRTDGTHSVSENDPYIVNYIKESDVRDEDSNTVLEIDDLREGDYFWTWDGNDFVDRISFLGEERVNEILDRMSTLKTWRELQDFVKYLEDIDGDAKRAFAIDPCGSKNGSNSISTNGDRNFRATIYGDNEYESLVFGVREDDYTYFLSDWDPAFMNSEIDISGTTKENPAFYDIYLLEPNLKFKLSERANTNIKTINAVDVNKNAVSITNNNGEYTIKFNSNFYNEVLFEIVGNNGKKYYFVVNRIVGRTWENIWDRDVEKLMGGVILLFPDTDKYSDYEIIANVTYNDGTFKAINVPNVKTYQDLYREGIENMAYVNEWHDGKGLKAASYGIELTSDITNLYFNAIKKGALESDSYGGTFAGSGRGFEFENLDRLLSEWSRRGERGE